MVNAINIGNFVPRIDPELLYCHPLTVNTNKEYRRAIFFCGFEWIER
jgi:hypothetical protein